MHLRQPGFTYSACGPFTLSKKEPGFTYSACGPFTKSMKEYKNLKKQEIHHMFIKAN